MTNRRLFFYNGLLLTAVGVAVRTVTLLFNAYVSRAVGAEGVGLFTLIGTLYNFAVTFATSGISLTMTRLVASSIGEGVEDRTGGILRSGILYALAFGLGTTAVLFFGAPLFSKYILFDARTLNSIRILSLSLVPIALTATFTGYFTGVKRVRKNAVCQVLSQGFRIVITIVAITRLAPRGVEYACIALSVGATLSEIFCFLVLLVEMLLERRGKSPAASGEGEGRAVASVALPLAFSAYVRSALLTIEHVLIPKRLRLRSDSASEALSAYGTLHGMALPMILYPMATLSSFSGLLVPEFAESTSAGERGRVARIASEALNTTLTYAVVVATLIFMFSEELGYVVYNSHSAGYYVSMLAPVIPIMYLDHVTDSMLKGIGEQVYSMWVNITDSLLSVVLVWFLIPAMGISGYALVIILMEGYNFTLSVIRLRGRIKFKIRPLQALILPAVFAAAAAGVTKELFGLWGAAASPLPLVMKIVFSVCLFIALEIFFGIAFSAIKFREGAPRVNLLSKK